MNRSVPGVQSIILLWDDLTDEFKAFHDEAAYNQYVSITYGHGVDGQIQAVVMPKNIHVVRLPLFSLETVCHAYAH